MLYERRGVGATVVATVLVAVIVVGTAAYVFVLAPGRVTSSSSSSISISTSLASTTPTATASSTASTTTSSFLTTSTSETSSSCPTSTASGGASNPLNFTSFFSAYSEMGVGFNGTYQGSSYDITSDYHVLYTSSTTFKVNITETVVGSSGSTTVKYTAWVLKGGTVQALFYSGQNYTGTYAYDFFLSAMAAYAIETTFTTPQTFTALTSGLFVHQTSQSTVMLGPTPVTVSDYVANTLPLMINECGFTSDFTKFSLQTGAVAGETVPLLTGLALDGSFSANGTTQNVNLTFAITSLTKAG